MRFGRAPAWVAVVVAAGSMAVPAGAAPVVHTVRVDVSTGGAVGNGDTDGSGIAMSADGRLIAFASSATNLVAGDTNGMRDVFVRNVRSGVTTRVDVGPGNVQANGDSFGPIAMSGDGRFVAFESDSSNLVAGSGCVPGQAPDCLFIRDRTSGTTRVVKRIPNPAVLALSQHGRYLVTAALAGPLVRIDLHTGHLVRVSCCGLGADLKNLSFGGMSASANLITFGLDSGPSGSPGDTFQVYLRNVARGTTTLISRSPAGAPGNNTSFAGGISPGGRYVIFTSRATNLGRYRVFASTASNLVRSDTNHAADIFIHDRRTGHTHRVDLSAAGTQANRGVGKFVPDGFAMTPGARWVAFVSDSTNLVPPVDAFNHTYLRGPLF
jgi:Tol biopolymer transport system component